MKKKHFIAIGLSVAMITGCITACMGQDKKIETEPVTEMETIENLETAKVTIVEPSMTPEEFEKLFIELTVSRMESDLEAIEPLKDSNKHAWFTSYKQVINNYADILDPPETIYDAFSKEELDLLFRVVHAEIGDEWSFEQKVNVANVIFNRVESDYFGDSLITVLIPGQFSTISNGAYHNTPSEKTIAACEYAYEIGIGIDNELYFDSNGALAKYSKLEWVRNDGAHNYYIQKEK